MYKIINLKFQDIEYNPKNAKYYEKIPEYNKLIEANIKRKETLSTEIPEYSNGTVKIINVIKYNS